MTPENPNIPDWAQRERLADLAWIGENLDVFWRTATAAFEDVGRGAIVVDTTVQPTSGAGNPFAYVSQEQVEEHGDEDTRRMVSGYDPTNELVLVLLKSGDRISIYWVGVLPPGSQEAVTREVKPGQAVSRQSPIHASACQWTRSGAASSPCAAFLQSQRCGCPARAG